MNIFISSYYKQNCYEYMKLQKSVMDKFQININYFTENEYSHHSDFIDNIMMLNYDTFIFFDIDCIPLEKNIIQNSVRLLNKFKLIGNLQFTNHARCTELNMNLGKNHNYCAPSFLCITKQFYEEIGKPSATAVRKSIDVAQIFSIKCDLLGYDKLMLTPYKVVRNKWKNDTYTTGTGTYYSYTDNKNFLHTYHEFQARKHDSKRFENECKKIIGV